jgi:hypothetical protein
MTDRTASDEAIDLIARALSDRWYMGDLHNESDPECDAEAILAALPAGLLRRLADQKDGGPLFEGTIALFASTWGRDARDSIRFRRVVVYPAPETTT